MKKLLLLSLFVLIIIGCGGEAVYVPLTVGNSWDYSMEITITTPDTVMTSTGTMITDITGETTLDNGTAVFEWVQEMTYDDTTMTDDIDTVYLQETEDYLLVYNDKVDADPDTVLVLPIEAGNTWTVRVDSADTVTASVIGKATVNVPAGSYEDCWQIESSVINGTETNWFAPDIGPVRHEYNYDETNFTVEVIIELESSTIN